MIQSLLHCHPRSSQSCLGVNITANVRTWSIIPAVWAWHEVAQMTCPSSLQRSMVEPGTKPGFPLSWLNHQTIFSPYKAALKYLHDDRLIPGVWWKKNINFQSKDSHYSVHFETVCLVIPLKIAFVFFNLDLCIKNPLQGSSLENHHVFCHDSLTKRYWGGRGGREDCFDVKKIHLAKSVKVAKKW